MFEEFFGVDLEEVINECIPIKLLKETVLMFRGHLNQRNAM